MSHRRAIAHRRNPSVDQPKYAPQGAFPSAASTPIPADGQPTAPTAAATAQISDYESDTQAYLSEAAGHQIPPSTRTTQQLNLSVLQRHDPEVTGILSIAPYAVIYEFSALPEPAWAKTGVEGSLFICQLTHGPMGEDRYSAMVLNRRGLDNFGAPLIEEEDAGVEITDEYVIISFKKGSEQKIYGVFIFSEGPGSSTANTREVNANLMKTLAALASASRQTAERDAAEARAQAQAQAQIQLSQSQPSQSPYANGHGHGHLHQQNSHLLSAANTTRGQHISLQQLFGQQPALDTGFGVRAPNQGGTVAPVFNQNSYPSQAPQQQQQQQQHQQHQQHQHQYQQPDVIGDLFRKAGIGMG